MKIKKFDYKEIRKEIEKCRKISMSSDVIKSRMMTVLCMIEYNRMLNENNLK